MRVPAIAGCVVLLGCADAQPPVHFLVEMHRSGRVVECISAQTVLGKNVRVPMSNGIAVTALARPMTDDGRSSVTVRIESSPMPGPSTFQVAHELSASYNLAQQSPTIQDTFGAFSFVVLVTSPALLATTRGEPSWEQHVNKPLTVNNRAASGECTPVLGTRKNDG